MKKYLPPATAFVISYQQGEANNEKTKIIQNFVKLLGVVILLHAFLRRNARPRPLRRRAVIFRGQDKNMSNGLTVAVVERRTVPLVTVTM